VGCAKYAGMEPTNLQVGILIGFECAFPPRCVVDALVSYIKGPAEKPDHF